MGGNLRRPRATNATACAAVIAAMAPAALAHDHAGEAGSWSPATGGPRLGFDAATVLGATIGEGEKSPSKLELLLDRSFATPAQRAVTRELERSRPRVSQGIVHRDGRVIDGVAAPQVTTFSTGATAGEPTMGITSDGTLFYVGFKKILPGVPGGGSSIVQRSKDGGATWETLDTLAPGTDADSLSLDPFLYVDKRTDRLFNVDLASVACSAISISDNRGDSFEPATTLRPRRPPEPLHGPCARGRSEALGL